MKQLKWEKIERGFNGDGQKWKLGDRIFIACRSYGAYVWIFFELPNIYDSSQIYKDAGDFRQVLKRFKLFINNKS